jgi:hypothetical protein
MSTVPQAEVRSAPTVAIPAASSAAIAAPIRVSPMRRADGSPKAKTESTSPRTVAARDTGVLFNRLRRRRNP